MAHVAPIYPNFARGEVSPLMFGRIDIEQYPSCLDKCRNTYIRPYGCATRLTGTEYVSSSKNSGKIRLLKFVFSATDSYIIECGAGYFRFYQNGAPVLKSSAPAWQQQTLYSVGTFVTNNGVMYYCVENVVTFPYQTFQDQLDAGYWVEQNIYEILNDYTEAQLSSIQYVQLDDIIKLTCLPDGANSTAKPKELIRKASDNWTFRNVTFKETPYLDQNTTDITMKPSAVTGSITIEASSAYFNANMVGANMWIGTKVKDTDTNKDVQGFVKITSYTDSTHVDATVKSKLSGTTATKLWGEGAFSNYRGYPSCVALYDGRLWYGRTPTQPRNIYGSKPYAYETFTPAVDNEDDAGINIELATNANGDGSDIKWLIGGSYLLCGTYGGEFVIRGTGDAAITATDISAKQRTNWGGEPIQPIVAGTFVHFIQRNGNKLRQFQYDYYYDAYKAVDVSIFSEHLLESPIKAMALQKNPDSIIYLMREDGNVVMLTLEQDQSVQAWSLLEEMGAKVESIQTIPSFDGNYDEVYMVMNRYELATTLDIVCSNPNLYITDIYNKVKAEGTEIVELEVTQHSNNLDWAEATENEALSVRGGNWYDLVFDGTKFVALGNSGSIATSSDGINWTTYIHNISGGNTWRALAYDGTKFVALSAYGHISTSTDGVTWTTAVQNQNLGENAWFALVYDGTKFVALGRDGYISTSTDGTTWTTAVQNQNLGDRTWRALAFSGTMFVALDRGGYVSTSTDGTTWTTAIRKITVGYWQSLIYDGFKFVALESYGRVSTSTDGTSWNTAFVKELSGTTEWACLTFDGNKLVALGTDGYISYANSWEWQDLGTGETANLSDYGIVVSGSAQIGDTITITYTTEETTPVRYIERMMNPITPKEPNEWWYVRSGLKYDGYAITEGVGLSLTANDGTVTATATNSIFTSSMEGNRIRLKDNNYNTLGEGTITEVLSNTQVTLEITTYFQSLAMTGGTWGISTDTLSGLDHLNGRTVQVYADCKEQATKIVDNGSIDIDDAFIAVVGLPYTSYITTMPMEAGSQNGTAVGKRKRISEMAIRVWNSIGVRVGRDLENLYDTIYQQQKPFTGVIPNIKYNQGWVWDANITVEQSHPYPMNILSIAPIVTEVDK